MWPSCTDGLLVCCGDEHRRCGGSPLPQGGRPCKQRGAVPPLPGVHILQGCQGAGWAATPAGKGRRARRPTKLRAGAAPPVRFLVPGLSWLASLGGQALWLPTTLPSSPCGLSPASQQAPSSGGWRTPRMRSEARCRAWRMPAALVSGQVGWQGFAQRARAGKGTALVCLGASSLPHPPLRIFAALGALQFGRHLGDNAVVTIVPQVGGAGPLGLRDGRADMQGAPD